MSILPYLQSEKVLTYKNLYSRLSNLGQPLLDLLILKYKLLDRIKSASDDQIDVVAFHELCYELACKNKGGYVLIGIRAIECLEILIDKFDMTNPTKKF